MKQPPVLFYVLCLIWYCLLFSMLYFKHHVFLVYTGIWWALPVWESLGFWSRLIWFSWRSRISWQWWRTCIRSGRISVARNSMLCRSKPTAVEAHTKLETLKRIQTVLSTKTSSTPSLTTFTGNPPIRMPQQPMVGMVLKKSRKWSQS